MNSISVETARHINKIFRKRNFNNVGFKNLCLGDRLEDKLNS